MRETEEEWLARVPPDVEGTDPEEATASRNLRIAAAMANGKSREEAQAAANAPREPRRGPAPNTARPAGGGAGLDLDLRKVDVPVLAINGELDRPLAKTHRLWRGLRSFTNVVLPGKSHLTAIVAGSMPPEYLEAVVRFVDSNDEAAS